MKSIDIIVAYHKPNIKIVDNPIYKPIYTKTNIGNNLNQYEPYLNELCSLYWYWKNTKNFPDLIGMQLYRRYFVFNYNTYSNKNISVMPNENDLLLNNIDFSVDIHLPAPLNVSSVYEQYMNDPGHKKIDMLYCKKLIKDKQDYFDQGMLFYSNMFILRKDLFNEYCEWLFNIIFKLLEFYEFKPTSRCFISERLTGLWLYNHKDKYNTKIIPTVTAPKIYY